jgi:serine/threonine protein kinase
MPYANGGDLLSYLNQNINKLTWLLKLECLWEIANCLMQFHWRNSVHCDLHGGNIVFELDPAENLIQAFICGVSLSRSIESDPESDIQGVLPYIAPEVFGTRKFTKESDIYSFGIIMYLVATGETPFQDRLFDKDLACDIVDGLQPTMPDSAPDDYKRLAAWCCDADPKKRPKDGKDVFEKVDILMRKVEGNVSGDDVWNTIYITSGK